MIVLSIVGLLASVSVPEFAKYKRKAKLAEAYAIVKNIKDGQQTFYLDNTHFCSLTANGGIYSEDYRFGSGLTDAWKQIGYPVAVRSVLNFVYSATAGEDNKSNSPSGPGSAGVCRAVWSPNAAGLGGSVGYPPEPSTKQCISSLTAEDLGVEGTPTTPYDWTIIVAKANLNKDASNQCTAVFTLLTTTDLGQSFSSTNLVTVSYDGE